MGMSAIDHDATASTVPTTAVRGLKIIGLGVAPTRPICRPGACDACASTPPIGWMQVNFWVNLVRSKILFSDAYRIIAVTEGGTCPVERFLVDGEATTRASRRYLVNMLSHVATVGLHKAPTAWFHEVNKEHGIYEFIKGDLRLLFFKGRQGDLVVCTTGLRKKGQKVDKAAVARSIRCRTDYLRALQQGTYEVLDT